MNFYVFITVQETTKYPKYIQPRISTFHGYVVSAIIAIIEWFLKNGTAFFKKQFCFVFLTRN